MNTEDMLETLTRVRPDMLNKETRLLFDTIMKEFDKRDAYKNALEEIEKYVIDYTDNKKIITYEQYKREILNIINKVKGSDK